jgi:surface antigen
MTIRTALLAATAILIGVTAAAAQPIYPPPGNDPDGYYSRMDRNGYYDQNGTYRRIMRDDGPPPGAYGPPPPPPPGYYQQGRYEENCHRGNAAAGTVFGALAGGLIGGAASRGNGGAVVGGAILGGLLGNTISRDIDCDDQGEAFRVYAGGLNGPLGVRSEWHHGSAYGYFTPTRDFRRDGSGTACRQGDGNWRFD